MERTGYISERFSKAGIELKKEQCAAFDRYAAMLVERNKSVNLTAITEFEDIVTKHFLDSVLLLLDDVSRETFLRAGHAGTDVSRETSPVKLVDVGTGAGFPGIPLRIVCPGIELTLIDALEKRVRFLAETVSELGCAETRLIHSRAEDAARDASLREAFDVCVSRAVAPLPVLCEYCLPFVRIGGVFFAYKALDCDQEIRDASAAIRLLGGKLEVVRELRLPGTDITRRILIITKISPTPDRYPRRAGKPEKSPL